MKRNDDQTDASSLPITFFSTFPSLRELELKGFGGLSTDQLAKLAESSSGLKVLNLSTSLWTFRAEDFDPPESAEPSDGERQIIEVLRSMPKLKRVDLGIFPYDESERELDELLVALEDFCLDRQIVMKAKAFDTLSDGFGYDSEGMYDEGWAY